MTVRGRGPAPKDPSKRARRNVDPIPATILEFQPGVQPELPDGSWPDMTRSWWAMWGRSPQSVLFTETDWQELLDTALLHRRLWEGDVKVAPELRLRVAKFGATPEDRARLRIQFAQADQADAKRPVEPKPSRERYGDLRATA